MPGLSRLGLWVPGIAAGGMMSLEERYILQLDVEYLPSRAVVLCGQRYLIRASPTPVGDSNGETVAYVLSILDVSLQQCPFR